MEKKNYVNICMTCFNRLSLTKRAISSILEKTTYPYILTVMDNNSKDGTKEYLKDLFDKKLIDNLLLFNENIGVAKASNLGWQCENTDYYLKFDNDIEIQDSNWLSTMVDVIDNVQELGNIGCNVENNSYPITIYNNYSVRMKHSNIGGACFLIPKRTEQLLGYWNEEYGLYSEEDYDYGWRIVASNLVNGYIENEKAAIHLQQENVLQEYDSFKRTCSNSTNVIKEKRRYEYIEHKIPLYIPRKTFLTDFTSCLYRNEK